MLTVDYTILLPSLLRCELNFWTRSVALVSKPAVRRPPKRPFCPNLDAIWQGRFETGYRSSFFHFGAVPKLRTPYPLPECTIRLLIYHAASHSLTARRIWCAGRPARLWSEPAIFVNWTLGVLAPLRLVVSLASLRFNDVNDATSDTSINTT
jgi:hypothetical protein